MRAANLPHYLEFVARLRRARVSAGLTQEQLAQRLGKPQSFVSKVETCERRLDLIEAAQWCLNLDISLDEVLPPQLKTAIAKRPTVQRGRER